AHLVFPRASNWNLNVDHQLSEHINLAARYLRRRGKDELTFVNTSDPNAPPSLLPLPAGNSPGIYQLTNLRRDDFDSVQFSIRQPSPEQYEWMAASPHPPAKPTLLTNLTAPEPLQVLPYFAAMPWDAPNRLLSWTYLPLPWKNWSMSAL